jgi:hypothetical protein
MCSGIIYEILNVFTFIAESSSGAESQKTGFQNLGTNYTCPRNIVLVLISFSMQ